MKKQKMYLMMLATTFLMATAGIAQVEFGAKAGMQFTNVTASNLNLGDIGLFDTKLRPGFTAGVYSEIPIQSKFSFAPELNYTEKGFRVAEGIQFDVFNDFPIPLGADINAKFRYLEMPLLFKYQLGQGPVQGYLTAGPTVGYAINGVINARIKSIINFNVARIPLPLKDNLYNQFEVGGQVGAGITFQTQNGRFFVDGKYTHGFTDIINDPVIDLGVKNTGFGMGVGYAYQF